MHAASVGLWVNMSELMANHDCFTVCDGNLRCDGEGPCPGKRRSTRLLNDLRKGETQSVILASSSSLADWSS